jgi:antitoxin Phd
MREWQLQQAKAQFSELVKNALQNGPQQVTLHGKPTVVVLSQEEYERLKKPKPTFILFLRKSPLMGIDLKLKRDSSKDRDTQL